MKYFHWYVTGLLAFLVGMAVLRTYLAEGLETMTKSKHIVLMGDSILRNDAYLQDGHTVEHWLKKRASIRNVLNVAENHAKVVDVFAQVERLPFDLDTQDTVIFLSAGGNDILAHYVDQQQDVSDMSMLVPLMRAHQELRESIQARLPKARVVALDIYYPQSPTYQRFHPILRSWNSRLESNAPHVLAISKCVTQPTDFVFGMEPSSSGGKKIAELIVRYSF